MPRQLMMLAAPLLPTLAARALPGHGLRVQGRTHDAASTCPASPSSSEPAH